MSIPLESLDKKHDAYDVEYWRDLDALYRGGKAFRARIENFLPQNPVESIEIYEQRKQEACYESYIGPIIDHYAGWLFSMDFKVRAKDKSGATITTPPKYVAIREQANEDVKLPDMLKERFTKALVEECSHWLCEIPAAATKPYPADMSQFATEGFDRCRLTKVNAEDLWYWEPDEDGKLLWCVIHSCKKARKSIRDKKCMIVETWRHYDATYCTTYQMTYPEGERPRKEDHVVPQLGEPYKHGFLQVPLVTLSIPEGMWITNRTSDPQSAHFRLDSALDWSIKRTCYAMPVFHLEGESPDPVMGAGYYLKIGKEETMTWAAPPAGQFDVIAKSVDSKRNAVYRMCHQMAQGLDNNAETVGRSADSKELDNAATRVMLNAYGKIVAQAIEETYEIISDALGDKDISWSIEGFTGYDTATAPQVIANVQNIQLLNIPSPTLMKEVKTKAAFAVAPEMSQDTKDKVTQEISDGIDAAGDHADLINAGYIPLNQRQSVEDAAKQAASKQSASSPPGSAPKRGKSASGAKSSGK